MTRIFDDLYTDSCITMDSYVYPKTAKDMHGLGQMNIGPDGISIEHVARPAMTEEDYPALIEDPENFRKNILLPRMFPFLFEKKTRQICRVFYEMLTVH